MAVVAKKYRMIDIIPGMKLAKPIISEMGAVMLSEGVVLDEKNIDRLTWLGFAYLEISEDVTADELQPSQPPVDIFFSPRINPAFEKKHTDIANTLEQAFEKIRRFKQIPIEELAPLTEQSLDLVRQSAGVLTNLALLDRKDRYTLIHSVNVGLATGIIGKWLGYTGAKLKELVLSGFLHDIGKTQIPLEILNKPSKLTEEELRIMKTHSEIGYKLIQQTDVLSPEAKNAVLQHHEKLDGSGYPLQLSSGQINQIAQMIAIADIYDALISNRVYRKAYTPFSVINIMLDDMFAGKINPAITSLFIGYLQESLVGLEVTLSDGQSAKIVYLSRVPGAAPILETSSGEFIDLSHDKSLQIVSLLSA